MKHNIAIFPGSFDPFTIGHESIVRRASAIYDKIIVGIGINTTKTSYFTFEKRLAMIQKVFENEPLVEVQSFDGLTVDFCTKVGARFILRGLRTSADFEYERAIAQMNHAMNPDIETVFMLTKPEHTHITSTIVREVMKHGGDASIFLPQVLRNEIYSG